MKKIFFTLLLGGLVISCNNNSATGNEESTGNAETATENTDIKVAYEANVVSFEKLCKAWGDQDLEGALDLMADDFMELSLIHI